MIYYKIYTSRVYRAVLYKDSHAGPIWLRGESSFVWSYQVLKELVPNGFEFIYTKLKISERKSCIFYRRLVSSAYILPVSSSGGLVLFGVCSVLMDIFKIIYYVGRMHCEPPEKIVFPIVQSLFVIVQVGENYKEWF